MTSNGQVWFVKIQILPCLVELLLVEMTIKNGFNSTILGALGGNYYQLEETILLSWQDPLEKLKELWSVPLSNSYLPELNIYVWIKNETESSVKQFKAYTSSWKRSGVVRNWISVQGMKSVLAIKIYWFKNLLYLYSFHRKLLQSAYFLFLLTKWDTNVFRKNSKTGRISIWVWGKLVSCACIFASY